MARKRKVFDKDGVFQTRFRALYMQSGLTQEAMAREMNVSRQTIAGWLDGGALPDILSLKQIAQTFQVSADYLLGFSDAATLDANARAAAEYTGLSEKAVEWLHLGLGDFVCDGVGISEDEARRNQRAASKLILNKNFTKILYYVSEVADNAYAERIVEILHERYAECDSDDETEHFRFARAEDRQVVADKMIHVMGFLGYFQEEAVLDKVRSMSDETLLGYVQQAWMGTREDNELNQFHAAKSFNKYLDEVIAGSRKKAEKLFEKNT